jgi:hypothetical protein
MGLVRAVCVFQHDNGLPEDRYVNNFYFHTSTTPSNGPDRVQIVGALQQFWNDTHAGMNAVGLHEYLSPTIDTSAADIVLYDMTDPEPRAPKLTAVNPLEAPGTVAGPHEVAMCLSFKGAPVSGQPAARRRGRVYVGPLATTAFGVDGRPATGFVEDLAIAGEFLLEENTANVQWVIYSPTDDPNPDGLSGGVPIVEVWVDNAYDTQRRRGLRPTSREIRP